LPRAACGRTIVEQVVSGTVALAGLAAVLALEPASPSLTWLAPVEACPGPREVEERLARLLGAEASAVRAEARVEARGSAWRVELALEWQGHRDVRVLEAPRCDTLANATVLLVATTADPAAVLRATREEPSPLEVPPPPAPAPVATPLWLEDAAPRPAPAPAPGRASPWPRDRGLALGLAGRFDLGSLPRVSAGLGAAVGWRWRRARLFAEAGYLPPRSVVSREPFARQGRVQLATIRVGACLRPWVRAVELPICGGAEAGVTRATGFGARADRNATDPWVALFADGGVTIPLMPSLAVFGRLGVAAPVVYTEYVFGDVRLHRAQPIALRGGLGLEFRWGQRNDGRPENPRRG
jgi:hypothetical protein